MRKLSAIICGTMFLALLLSITAFIPLALKGPSANGQGGIIPDNNNPTNDLQHFSFHANTDAQGVVSGSWESHSPGQNTDTHGEITCLTVLPDGKTAILSGVVTKVNENNPLSVTVGTPIWFKVQDNGEGAKAVEDAFTDYYFFTSGCTDYGFPLRPIINGNIQVKP